MAQDVGGFITELKFDGTALVHASFDWVLWLTRGINDVPSVRGRDDVVPKATGRTPRARVADVLPLELYGWVLAHGDTLDEAVANYRTSVRALQDLFDPVADPKVLSGTLEDGTLATISARCSPPVSIVEVVAGHVAEVRIALESVDPYWQLSAP